MLDNQESPSKELKQEDEISLEIHGTLKDGGTIDVSVLADEECVRKVMNTLLSYGFKGVQ